MFGLEDAIMSCWSTKEDIELLCENVLEKDLSKDEIANVLMGIAGIHDMRCQKAFAIFEQGIQRPL